MNENLVHVEQYNDNIASNVQTLIKSVNELTGVQISSLALIDLVLPAHQSNGVYLFVSPGDDIIYVGKASSRCFVERLGGHFDLRAGNWFASFLRAYAREINKIKGELSNEDYENSYTAILNYRLKMVAISAPANQGDLSKVNKAIGKIEREFIKYYKSQSGIMVLNR